MKKVIVSLVLLCLMIMCFSCGTRENDGADNNATETPVSALTNTSTPTFTDTPTEVITERPTSSPVNHPYGPVTRENAEKVTVGMTMEDVINILGKDKGADQGSGAEIYVWPIDDGQYLYTWWNTVGNTKYLSSMKIRDDFEPAPWIK